MPAAAVIPAPIAYINVVAVKKLVVGFWACLAGHGEVGFPSLSLSSRGGGGGGGLPIKTPCRGGWGWGVGLSLSSEGGGPLSSSAFPLVGLASSGGCGGVKNPPPSTFFF